MYEFVTVNQADYIVVFYILSAEDARNSLEVDHSDTILKNALSQVSKLRTERAATNITSHLWENATIPYTFDRNFRKCYNIVA